MLRRGLLEPAGAELMHAGLGEGGEEREEEGEEEYDYEEEEEEEQLDPLRAAMEGFVDERGVRHVG